jgi:hypothetical protein
VRKVAPYATTLQVRKVAPYATTLQVRKVAPYATTLQVRRSLACLPARLPPETQRGFYTGRRRGRPLRRRRKSASGLETGGAETHAAAGFGFGFGFVNRRCGSARHRRVRVRTDRLAGSATGLTKWEQGV